MGTVEGGGSYEVVYLLNDYAALARWTSQYCKQITPY
jgi:hypothetical protein